MTGTPLSLDTSPEVEQRQIEGWRRLTPAAKVDLVLQMNATVRQLAFVGVRQRYPHASARELQLRLAELLLGSELARRAYPEIADLDPR